MALLLSFISARKNTRDNSPERQNARAYEQGKTARVRVFSCFGGLCCLPSWHEREKRRPQVTQPGLHLHPKPARRSKILRRENAKKTVCRVKSSVHLKEPTRHSSLVWKIKKHIIGRVRELEGPKRCRGQRGSDLAPDN